MADVFLSYSRSDRAVAQSMAFELQQLGVDVWWDHELVGGDDYRQRIAEILARSQVVVVVWSRQSVESQWVVGEASYAREKKTLLPVNIDGSAPPLDFRALHTVELSGWLPGDRLDPRLLKALSERLQRTIDYGTAAAATSSGLQRIAREAARSWYRDAESLLFHFIAQGFACSLFNTPVAVFSAKLPGWVPWLIVGINGMIGAALCLRPALETKRMGIAIPLFVLAAALSFPSYVAALWLWQQSTPELFVTICGFWALALLLCLDIARRAAGRT